MADIIQGLLGNPRFNSGIGLLAGVLGRPSSVAEAVQPAGLLLQNQVQRERILAAQRQRSALDQLPGLLSGDQGQLVGLLGDIAPEQLATGLLGQIFPKQQGATSFQRDFAFLLSIGLTPEQALDRLRKGTTVNVGTGEKAVGVSGAKGLRFAEGTEGFKQFGPNVPPNMLLNDAVQLGATVVARQPSAEEEKQGTQTTIGLDTLDRLDSVVTKNKIKTGFIDEGGIAQFMATPTGQIISGLIDIKDPRTGKSVRLTKEQADALSLQESLSNQLLAAIRGAQVGPAEQERFERQLPRLTQPPSVFRANVENTRRNLKFLAKKLREKGVGITSPPKITPKRKTPKVIDFNDLPG